MLSPKSSRPFVTLESPPSESHIGEIQGDVAGGGGSPAAQGWAASDVGLLTLKPRSPLSVWTRLTARLAPNLDPGHPMETILSNKWPRRYDVNAIVIGCRHEAERWGLTAAQ